MKRRSSYCLLFMLAIAMAVAPLRGVLALPAPAADGAMSHCPMLQGDRHADPGPADLPAPAAGKHCPGCAQDCPGDRCAGHCAAFTHAFVALADGLAAVPVTRGGTLAAASAGAFPDCTISPLYRPPIPAS